MHRTVKLVVIAAIAWMTFVALGLIAWKGWTTPGLSAAHPVRYTVFFLFYPIWLALGVAYLSRRAGSNRPRLSDNHRRYVEIGLVAVATTAAALQGLSAFAFLQSHALDMQVVVRLALVFVGAVVTVQGNFAAKLDPPTGESAPNPAVWTRAVLGMGWVMVVLGLAIIVGALTLPVAQMLPMLLVLWALGFGVEVYCRRMTRPRRHA